MSALATMPPATTPPSWKSGKNAAVAPFTTSNGEGENTGILFSFATLMMLSNAACAELP